MGEEHDLDRYEFRELNDGSLRDPGGVHLAISPGTNTLAMKLQLEPAKGGTCAVSSRFRAGSPASCARLLLLPFGALLQSWITAALALLG